MATENTAKARSPPSTPVGLELQARIPLATNPAATGFTCRFMLSSVDVSFMTVPSRCCREGNANTAAGTMALLAAGRCVGRVGRGPGGGERRVEVAGWRASLPVGHSHTPNDDDSIIIIFFATLYSGDVWGWRTGVLGVVRGEWRVDMVR